MTIHSRRVNAVMKRPTRPQMMQTILRKRSPHAGFGESCSFFSAGGMFWGSTSGPGMLPQATPVAEL
jgi:hypothetical protein